MSVTSVCYLARTCNSIDSEKNYTVNTAEYGCDLWNWDQHRIGLHFKRVKILPIRGSKIDLVVSLRKFKFRRYGDQ